MNIVANIKDESKDRVGNVQWQSHWFRWLMLLLPLDAWQSHAPASNHSSTTQLWINQFRGRQYNALVRANINTQHNTFTFTLQSALINNATQLIASIAILMRSLIFQFVIKTHQFLFGKHNFILKISMIHTINAQLLGKRADSCTVHRPLQDWSATRKKTVSESTTATQTPPFTAHRRLSYKPFAYALRCKGNQRSFAMLMTIANTQKKEALSATTTAMLTISTTTTTTTSATSATTVLLKKLYCFRLALEMLLYFT